MIVPVYSISDNERGPMTLLGPAMKLMEEYRRVKANREAQSTELLRIMAFAEQHVAMELDHERLKAIAYAPTGLPRDVLSVESVLFHPGREHSSMNISSIQTRLIQEAGRWCLDYASDVLLGIARLQPFEALDTDHAPEEETRWIIGFGLRESGCDHNAYIISRLADTERGGPYIYPQHVYRKLLAVLIEDKPEDGWMRRTVSLLDLTHSVSKLDPEDRHDQA